MDDRQIANLAGKFRGSYRPTDVLAFDYRAPNGSPTEAFGDDVGEIVISLDTAGRQARERGQTLTVELTLLCVHGLLHLAGVGDETRKDFCRMRVMEFETMMRIMP